MQQPTPAYPHCQYNHFWEVRVLIQFLEHEKRVDEFEFPATRNEKLIGTAERNVISVMAKRQKSRLWWTHKMISKCDCHRGESYLKYISKVAYVMQRGQRRAQQQQQQPPGKSPIFFSDFNKRERAALICLSAPLFCDMWSARRKMRDERQWMMCDSRVTVWCGKSLLTHHSVDYRHYHQQHTRAPLTMPLCVSHRTYCSSVQIARRQPANALSRFFPFPHINPEIRRTHWRGPNNLSKFANWRHSY